MLQARLSELTVRHAADRARRGHRRGQGNAGAAGKVRLNYLVDAASWRPQYKLRAGKTAKEPVQLEYLAAVVQHTGEDWSNVKLVLSTAQPMLNAAPPDLQIAATSPPSTRQRRRPRTTDVIDLEEQVRSLRNKAQKDFNERKPTTGIGLFNTAAALDQSFELLNPDAAIKRGCALAIREGPTVTYHLSTPLTVPSRTDEQVIEVARIDLTPEYYYKAVPAPDDARLPPGRPGQQERARPAARRGDHVHRQRFRRPDEPAAGGHRRAVHGRLRRRSAAAGDSGRWSTRRAPRRAATRCSATSTASWSATYKNEKVKLQVWDRLPRAETDAVTVSLVKSTPEISKDPAYLREQRTQNLLRWDVTVEPNATGEKALAIQYEFKMELDRQMTISDFQSAGAFGKPAATQLGRWPPPPPPSRPGSTRPWPS